ncbi:endopeptidase, partial [Streptococcus gordonii]|nr:endopeptidase [Streptococcus gordonii]
AELLAKWRKAQEDLLAKFDFTEEEIKDLLDKVLDLDAVFAQYVLSNEESSEYAKLYHPYKWNDFKAFVPELPLADIFTKLIGQEPDQVIVPEERFWKAAKDIYT